MIECRDVLSGVFIIWSAAHLFRFAVAIDALIHAPIPAVPSKLVLEQATSRMNGNASAYMEAQCAWLCACDVAAEEARFARLTEMALITDAGDILHVSLCAYVHELCARFADYFRVGLFDDLDVLNEDEEQARRNKKREREARLVDELRGCTTLLFAHDTRVQRFLHDSVERFFACTPPPEQRARTFQKTCQRLGQAFMRGDLDLAEVGTAAAHEWLFG